MNENIGRLKSPYVFLIRSSFFQLMIEFIIPNFSVTGALLEER